MRCVTRIETCDGKLHEAVDAARRHADRQYGDALTRLAHRALAVEKYTKMVDFIDQNLEAFAELKVLKADVEMENGEDI